MRTTATLTATGTALLAVAVLAGCGGSGHSGGSAASGGSTKSDVAKAAAAAGSQALGSALQNAQDQTTKVCAAISPADVGAILKAPSAVTVDPLQCNWNGGNLSLTIYPNDTGAKDYNDQVSLGSGHPLSGVGDHAVWLQPVPGATVPEVVSRKGTTTCQVQLSADPPATTLPYTGSSPFFKITDSDAASYSAKLGVLCAKAFAAM